MSHLKDLINHFSKTEESERDLRERLVLEMIDYTIMYPPPHSVSEDLDNVAICIHKVVRELIEMGEHILARRIHKIWGQRDHLLQLAENASRVSHNYMDALEYHQEVKWVKKEMSFLPTDSLH